MACFLTKTFEFEMVPVWERQLELLHIMTLGVKTVRIAT